MSPELNQDQQGQGREAGIPAPFFSIVTPVWNRGQSIRRCLDSVLSQDFSDFEIVAVDDASTDDTVAVLRTYADARIRVVSLSENRGVCGARNAGTAVARGQWFVSLDSDWALAPGALGELAALAREAPADVGVIGGCAQSDRGEIWPLRSPPEGPFAFEDFLRWTDTLGPSDYLPCRRREVFRDVQWPTDRRWESQFHLRVASRWRYWISRKILANAYTDSPNRLTADRSASAEQRKLEVAPYLAADAEEILATFGRQLKRYAPRRYFAMRQDAAIYSFLAGKRGRGLKHASLLLARRPWSLTAWALIPAGMLGPKTVYRIRQWRSTKAVLGFLSRHEGP
jgi:glycosyltransferase involved in cell wall biosynthesis